MPDAHVVTLYSRPRCGLCDRAREQILALREGADFELEEVSIEGDQELEREYGLRIPVVAIDGEERFEVELSADELRAALR